MQPVCPVVFKQKFDLSKAKAARLSLYTTHGLSGANDALDHFLNEGPVLRETRAYVEGLGLGLTKTQPLLTLVGNRSDRHQLVTELPVSTSSTSVQIQLRIRSWCADGSGDPPTTEASTWTVDTIQLEIEQ